MCHTVGGFEEDQNSTRKQMTVIKNGHRVDSYWYYLFINCMKEGYNQDINFNCAMQKKKKSLLLKKLKWALGSTGLQNQEIRKENIYSVIHNEDLID